MLTKSAFLSLLIGLPAFAQVRPIGRPVYTNTQNQCSKYVADLSYKLGIQDDSYFLCSSHNGSNDLLKLKKEIPGCVEKIIELSNERYDLIGKCLSKQMRDALKSNGGYINCLSVTKNAGFGQDNLNLCKDAQVMALVRNPDFLSCIETQREQYPYYAIGSHIQTCKDKKKLEALSSPAVKKCRTIMEGLSGNRSASLNYCMNPLNQNAQHLAGVKDCVQLVGPITTTEYGLKFCTPQGASKKMNSQVAACLSSSISVLSKNYFEDDGKTLNLLPMLQDMVKECQSPKPIVESKGPIKFHAAKILSHNLNLNFSRVGGLSGLSFDNERGYLYIVSDDPGHRGPTRFFEFKFDLLDGINLEFQAVNNLRTTNSSGRFFGYKKTHNIDAEGIVSTPDGRTIVSSETLLNNSKSFIKIYDERNDQVEEIVLTDKFLPEIKNIEKEEKYIEYEWVKEEPQDKPEATEQEGEEESKTEPKKEPKKPQVLVRRPVERTRKVIERLQVQGIYQNRGFEALTGNHDGSILFTANEYPLIQDNFKRRKLVRIIKLQQDDKSYQTAAEYAYELDRTEENGLVDMVVLNETTLLTLERRYDAAANKVTAQIFEVSLEGAQDYQEVRSFWEEETKKPIVGLKKKLLINLDEILPHLPKGLDKIDNLEGLALGPKLPNGNRSLLLVSDNNFSQRQFTQFIVLELSNN